MSRLDFLLSSFAFQKAADGEWESLADWYGLARLAQGRLLIPLGNLPREQLQAIRFVVGVPPEINVADPHAHPADHPLNPNVNGLHWGWQGSYVFLALEGHHGENGFSYHIANDANLMQVTLPAEVDGSRQQTLKVEFDLAVVLGSLNLAKDGASTHSRDGDPLAARLKSQIEKAFVFAGSSSDRYHFPSPVHAAPGQPLGQPFSPADHAAVSQGRRCLWIIH